ncbi:hypothetical protein GCM10010394_35000 [Streptomyces crystallinus]|uniref:Transposase n=1 Tax=Streptomyces crystallinus TaxID=68191 RepID=A0ABN1G1T7_9ACTN
MGPRPYRQLGLARKEDSPGRQFAHAQRLAECRIAQVALLRGLVKTPYQVCRNTSPWVCRLIVYVQAAGSRPE